ncbi:SAVED domain-containing protein [Corallococcus terminator]|uniref:SAVED domain-containing protein n=1 Tax=Corallococcus terminator TaxID=2316733 RepID=A0A3A8JIK6_9BACT|nr:SAVED domain-containing protein [Corallococcus terminator]RKG89313.1 SAVED domain-containing protein [Corallococcus terminator]
MKPVGQPLEIILTFTCTEKVEAFSPFPWKERQYLVEVGKGRSAPVSFDWSNQEIRNALEFWDRLEPGSKVMEGLVRCLQDFLRGSDWPAAEKQIEDALKASPPRPVHLVIQTKNAEELNYLPWELLRLRGSEKRLVALDDCHIQYECLPSPPRDPLRPLTGRILFAYSSAGGAVPASAHINAIRDACDGTQILFDPKQDVLSEVSRASLVRKLEEKDRPVTVLHLLCHGTRVGGSAYGLSFSSVDSPAESEHIDAREFQDLIFSGRRASSLRLVTLCSCQGGDSGEPANLVGSMASMLHSREIPAVIASRMPLMCEGSVILTEVLYDGLLQQRKNLRTALSEARKKLRTQTKYRDWLSLQLYARAGDETALTPFTKPPPVSGPSFRKLILIRHEAYSRVAVDPEPADAPALFNDRQAHVISIDQTALLEQREWKNLPEEVARLSAPDGTLRMAYSERDADVGYYGFPYVPLAALAGFLAKSRDVHVFEYVSNRFQWEAGNETFLSTLESDVQPRESGDTARLRLSVSAPVSLEDCRQVLPDPEVALDMHFSLQMPKRGSVRQEEQLKLYVQKIQDALDQYISGSPLRPLRSIHVFAAVPVSVAFLLGKVLAATWLPECFIYNYGRTERPAYKWRLSLQAAAQGKRSVKIFK